MLADHKTILKTSDKPLLIFNSTKKIIVDANISYKNFSGFNLKDIREKKITVIFPEGQKKKNEQKIIEAINKGKSNLKELLIERKSSPSIKVNLKFFKLNKTDQENYIIQLSEIKSDKNKNKLKEQNYNVFDEITDPVIIINKNLEIKYFNKSAKNIFKWNNKKWLWHMFLFKESERI